MPKIRREPLTGRAISGISCKRLVAAAATRRPERQLARSCGRAARARKRAPSPPRASRPRSAPASARSAPSAAPNSSTPRTASPSISRATRARPVNQGTLCPKGASTLGVLLSPRSASTTVLYRKPRMRTEWERSARSTGRWSAWPTASPSRSATRPSSRHLPGGISVVNHTIGLGSLGGATLDNEENYLIKKLFGGGLGMVSIENQARI